jgi:hypothetical protein
MERGPLRVPLKTFLAAPLPEFHLVRRRFPCSIPYGFAWFGHPPYSG